MVSCTPKYSPQINRRGRAIHGQSTGSLQSTGSVVHLPRPVAHPGPDHYVPATPVGHAAPGSDDFAHTADGRSWAVVVCRHGTASGQQPQPPAPCTATSHHRSEPRQFTATGPTPTETRLQLPTTTTAHTSSSQSFLWSRVRSYQISNNWHPFNITYWQVLSSILYLFH